jgi:hypothetical protein
MQIGELAGMTGKEIAGMFNVQKLDFHESHNKHGGYYERLVGTSIARSKIPLADILASHHNPHSWALVEPPASKLGQRKILIPVVKDDYVSPGKLELQDVELIFPFPLNESGRYHEIQREAYRKIVEAYNNSPQLNLEKLVR